MDFARNTVELTPSWVTLGMEKRDSQGLRFFECFHELPLADQRMAAVKKIVADNPLLSLFGMDNAP